ncbi:DUF6622 family protein [Devosia sp.]|uniref:DUF6622 family protein n=1 Tax=Devosia sp. TaxID=1871048 RepID=UPI003BAA4E50
MRPSLFLSIPVLVALSTAAEAAMPGSADAGLLGNIVSHTPFWVWVLLVGLIALGLKWTQPRQTGLVGIFAVPAIMVLLSLSHLLSDGLSMVSLAALALGGLLGVAAGLSLERRYRPTALGGGRLQLAGEWTPLLVMLGVFLTRYAGAAVAAAAPVVAEGLEFRLTLGGLSAFFALLLVTRTTLRLRVALGPIADPATA